MKPNPPKSNPNILPLSTTKPVRIFKYATSRTSNYETTSKPPSYSKAHSDPNNALLSIATQAKNLQPTDL